MQKKESHFHEWICKNRHGYLQRFRKNVPNVDQNNTLKNTVIFTYRRVCYRDSRKGSKHQSFSCKNRRTKQQKHEL